ncbi:testis-specific serine/threonine-protein kinase 1-like [Alligator sinensis]|uniref:non-specific serine/threonine protein kinase n=1 Tax=Alligator sinensis TaxID=38654 RepID=A0A1U7RP61_ALLSI|nr:testis-specific serine/threonine-protein kinase 1-like [Alligator sinensis]
MDDAAVLKKRRYVLGMKLGEGSYAKVKCAYSEKLKFNVAVKIIDKKRAPRDFLERFLPREIDILAKVNHCSIVKTYEIFEISDRKVYIVMELGVQGDLLEFIKTRGSIPENVARKMFYQLGSAIKYCHDLDIVHRDLKCENLLLDKDFNIKLSDFGFSKCLSRDEDGKITLSKTFCGSAAYAAPEVLQGIPYEPKIYDIWSLGVILFIMVCGSMPYDDSNVRKMLKIQKEHRVHFPRSKTLTIECKDIVYQMLQPDVSRRLNIDEVLSHIWMQTPKSQGPSPALYAKAGECSRNLEEVKSEHKQENEPQAETKTDKKHEFKTATKLNLSVNAEDAVQEEGQTEIDVLADQMQKTQIKNGSN